MPAIDKLLAALADAGMDCLVLEPGRRPSMRRGTEDHEVTKSVLDDATIGRLLAEVAPAGESPESRPEDRWEFDYSTAGRVFRFLGLRGPRGWLVSVVHDANAAPPSPAPAAAPSPGASPGSVADSPLPRPEATAPRTTAAAPADGTVEIPDVPTLLAEANDLGASDLHLSSLQPPRMRIDGELVVADRYRPPSPDRLEKLLLDIAPKANREEFTETNDTDFGYELEGRDRFRANLYRELGGIAAAFRRIPRTLPSPEQLGLPPIVGRIAALTKGLVLVVGPTGSGKSTTLASLLDTINRSRSDHIVTIEDPIEFVHRSRQGLIHQRQVGLHTRSFVSALRAALREDPDVVMVGEMRDLETTSIAIKTAETGHLVFGTLHTTSAPGTVERIIDQYPADQQGQIRLMLSTSLRAVIAQVLLKKIGGGRVAAFETLLATPAISNLVREGKTFQISSAMQTGRRQGMILLDDSLAGLVERKLVAPEEAYRKANRKDEFATRLRQLGADLSFLDADPLDGEG